MMIFGFYVSTPYDVSMWYIGRCSKSAQYSWRDVKLIADAVTRRWYIFKYLPENRDEHKILVGMKFSGDTKRQGQWWIRCLSV
jgi:hypothetical protein